MKDTDQLQRLGFDPFECLQLFIRFHDESHGTLRLIPHKNHILYAIVLAGEQATCFERNLLIDVPNHFFDLGLVKRQLGNHLNE
jgi:hypothetical protein